jgi:SAM-dependent methyltransferase
MAANMADFRRESAPDGLLTQFSYLFSEDLTDHPVLDLACGDGHNGIFLASKGLSVIMADRSEEALSKARLQAQAAGVAAQFWRVDLEQKDLNPLEGLTFSAILVFRYLHRPLIPCIRKSLRQGGILIYETFTAEQARFGKPKNPDHLLRAGELLSLFHAREVIYTFEGTVGDPPKAIAQLVCRKPFATGPI